MAGDTTIEKVELTQDLLATFESGIEPSPDTLKRAKELGIDVKTMREHYGDSFD